jgi:hypothetical protein
MEQKREWLYRLLQQVQEDEKQEVQNMLELMDTCLNQIHQTDENVLYIAECMDTTEQVEMKKDDIVTSESAELTFYDDITEMTEYLEKTYRPKPDEVNREMYVYQVIKTPHKKHRIKIEFCMTWFDGKLGIFNVYPDDGWLEQKGIHKETIHSFANCGICYKELPFSKGDRLRIKTPLMRDYVYGTVTYAECDDYGCWYYYFIPCGKETDLDSPQYMENMIHLNYQEINMTSGYNVYDWVEIMR